ncbi:TetR/AcrR family transcriptional regulator [Patulibacter defluvii]|uniref:TetR/AcrR family transcriptional regulator n=1 Tax=Patulibacter defluvii TaxID=3095358 RepID=UPI002A75B1C6|nr:TetR/AcrR family transcriptional regulator [Patulibacter sp. DM4]
MSPRRSVAETRDTHREIVRHAAAVASVAGLEKLSLGGLARDLGMSKAGVAGHFANKEQLQLEAVEAAVAVFTEQVAGVVRDRPPGRAALLDALEAWFAYLERCPLPGGCFLTAAACEYDGRPGPVREAVADAIGRWGRLLRRNVVQAQADGELPAGLDPDQAVFVLQALGPGLNQAVQLHGDPRAGGYARAAARAALGLPPA